MPPIPNQAFTLPERGLNLSSPTASLPLFYGRSSLGTANEIVTVSSPSALVTAFGQGPMVESAAYTLANAGGPVRCMKSANSVAGSLSAVVPSGAGPTVTVAGTPNDAYRATVRVKLGGALGAGQFDYSLDGVEYSAILTIPTGGTFLIPDTGVTVTFAAGTYVLNDTYTFTATPPMWNGADLAAAFTALATSPYWWDFFVGCGSAASSSAGAALAAAMQTGLASLANTHRYKAGMLDTGIDTQATVVTSYASTIANRVLAAYGWARVPSAKAFTGWAKPRLRLVDVVACMAKQALLSTDLGRVASGAIPGCDAVEHDEFLNQVLDAARITTARTYPGEPGVSGLDGYFLTQGRTLAQSGSDYQLWQYRRIMNVACQVVYAEQAQMMNEDFTVKDDGTISDEDAGRWEDRVTEKLNDALVRVKSASGSKGFVSALRYTINREVVLSQTQTIVTEVAIQPKGYGKFIQTQLGFVPQLFLQAA